MHRRDDTLDCTEMIRWSVPTKTFDDHISQPGATYTTRAHRQQVVRGIPDSDAKSTIACHIESYLENDLLALLDR